MMFSWITPQLCFQPSFDAKQGGKRVGTQSAAAAPGEGDDEPPESARRLDADLAAKVAAIKARQIGTVPAEMAAATPGSRRGRADTTAVNQDDRMRAAE